MITLLGVLFLRDGAVSRRRVVHVFAVAGAVSARDSNSSAFVERVWPRRKSNKDVAGLLKVSHYTVAAQRIHIMRSSNCTACPILSPMLSAKRSFPEVAIGYRV